MSLDLSIGRIIGRCHWQYDLHEYDLEVNGAGRPLAEYLEDIPKQLFPCVIAWEDDSGADSEIRMDDGALHDDFSERNRSWDDSGMIISDT